MKVLIASLGNSPAAITATVDAVEREERTTIDQVVTIGTRDWDVTRSQELLTREFGERGIPYVPDWIEASDLLTEDDHLSYLAKVAENLRTYQQQTVYLSLSGGRKTMSALVMIAAQLYGAEALYHLVSDPELEEQGQVHKLRNAPREVQQRILHPPAEAVRLIRIPLINLFPMLDDFVAVLRGQGGDRRARDLLAASRLIEGSGDVVTATATGQSLLKLLERVEQLPPPRPGLPEVVVRAHGYGGNRPRVEQCARRLADACQWVTRVETTDYGSRPRTRIRSTHPDGRIEVDVKIGEIGIGLVLHTTAQTEGQVERVAREVEKRLT